MAMKRFEDASTSATRSVALDPKLTKGWMILGQATHTLEQYQASKVAWTKALESLPADAKMTGAHQRLKEECETGLDAAEREERASQRSSAHQQWNGSVGSGSWSGSGEGPSLSQRSDRMPWERANALTSSMKESENSSAWVILSAFKDFEAGLLGLRKLRRTVVDGHESWDGRPDVLMRLTTGILRDPRILLAASQSDLNRIEAQINFECGRHDAWILLDAETVRREAVARQREHGWDRVRPAVRTTLWTWIIQGSIAAKEGKAEVALEHYSHTLQVLEWGRRTWKRVPRGSRGAVFDSTYVRCVRRLFLHAYLKAYESAPDAYDLDDLYDLSREHVQGARLTMPSAATDFQSPLHPGTEGSYWHYPIADGLAIMGSVHIYRARESGTMTKARAEQLRRAAKLFEEAANVLPEDDEKHIHLLVRAANALQHHDKVYSDALVAKAREKVPMIKKIWEFSESEEMDLLETEKVVEERATLDVAIEEVARTVR
ncbi:hypothetical protein OF83DRAFT_1090542 [Amylostereum chailletii]|nr:hypothetical protein OF83DRAFT_1090542 [Amylostereum chailletii]